MSAASSGDPESLRWWSREDHIMRIDALNRTPLTPGAEKSEPTAPTVPAAEDQAGISRLAQSLATPDASRVEQLRLQVESGSYDVSAETVAKALIEAHLTE
jgi:anti-sigma28 factor (negative regulator of flagellin synthesis)